MKRVINCPNCQKPADYDTDESSLEQKVDNPDGSITRYYKLRHMDCGYSFADTVHTPAPIGCKLNVDQLATFSFSNESLLQTVTFSGGAKRGTDEIRYDLLPIEMLERATTAFVEGEAKYGKFNYRKGIPTQNLLNHAIRHLFQYQDWLSREDRGVPAEDHLAHALANLGMLCWMEANKNDAS